jgi:hypothetical protein
MQLKQLAVAATEQVIHVYCNKQSVGPDCTVSE